MNSQESIETIAAELDEVLTGKNVPPQFRKLGARLLGNLRRPLQILVTGLPGSGKSSLINMFLSQPVLGKNAGVPVLDVAYGAKERVLFEFEDGSVSTKDGVLSNIAFLDQLLRVQQELPNPALNGLVYRELSLGSQNAANKNVLEVALQEADIVLWCTSMFDEAERTLWSAAPDEIKDHSFLVITQADQQMMQGVLSETIRLLEPVAGEEFLGLFPVASLQAVAALTGGLKKDEHLWKLSGGKSLQEEIRDQIRSGRAADVDRAQMILTHSAVEVSQAQTRSNTPNPAAERARVSPPSAARSIASGHRSHADAASGTPVCEALPDAVHMMGLAGKEMLRDLGGDVALDTDAILTRCVETMEALTSRLQSAAFDAPALLDALEDAQKGEEMMVLFQLERGEDATLDAIMLLLQLQKEFAARASA